MKKSILFLFVSIAVFTGCQTPAPAPVRQDLAARVTIRPGGPLAIGIEQIGHLQAISGIQGVRLEPTDVLITFRNARLREGFRPGTEVNWITNLPAGLTARIREANRGSNTIILLVEGVPQITLNEEMRFNFPHYVLDSLQNFAFSSEDVKFEILQGSLELPPFAMPMPPPRNYIRIHGLVGTELPAFNFRINLVETALQTAILEETPVNWVVNRPAGLSISVQPASAGATTLFLTVTGTPQEAKTEAVRITIPGHVLGDVSNFTVPNELILWNVIGGTIQPVIISGSVGSAINTRDLTINLMGTEFSQDMAPGTVVNWVTNLPPGLTARVRRVRAGETTGVITVAGTPNIPSTDVLNIVVPGFALRDTATVSVITNVDARFAINDNTRIISFSQISDGTSNPNWMGPQIGPLNVPMLPPVKDFEGVGIVTVRAIAVERLGPDNQYHWSGERINYGRLMEEAQRLGAHAIINVVIDYTDNVEFMEVIRELAPEHEWSADELDKISRGILREIRRDNVRYSVETSHVITRTYIGSALAIRYISGTNFVR